MGTYLAAMNEVATHPRRLDDAVACLDLSGVPVITRTEVGKDAAIQLIEVLDRIGRIDWKNYPEDPSGDPFIVHRDRLGNIVLARSDSGEWLFTGETVKAIPTLFREYEDRETKVESKDLIASMSPALWLRSKFPASMRKVGFLLEHWQWMSLLILIFAGFILQKIVAYLINHKLASPLGKIDGWERLNPTDKEVGRPAGYVIAAGLWWVGVKLIALPAAASAVLLIGIQALATIGGAVAAFKAINVGTGLWAVKAAKTESKFDDLLVPLVRSTLICTEVVVAVIFLANTLYENPTSLLAGLGIGGLAFALAANDILKNLFGSFTLLLDRPFQIGDWVLIEGTEGTVEKVGFRTTRIRTFYNSLVTLPNSKITSSAIDNYGARRYRRLKTYISLAYDTPAEKIEAYVEGVRELVRRHPDTRKDYFHVYVNQLSESSVDVLLYIFFEVPDWGKELAAREKILLDILRLADKLNVEIAFPTQTLHVRKEEPPHHGASPVSVDEAHELGVREAAAIAKVSYGDRKT